jgi:hypothetical protein
MKKYGIFLAVCIILLSAVVPAAAGSKKKAGQDAADKAPQSEAASGTAVKCESGKIRLILQGSIGTCRLYAVGKDGTAVPVFVDYDEFTSSYFILRAGKTEYKLNESNGVAAGAVRTDSGGRLVYSVPNTADVSIEFTPEKTRPDSDDDMLRVQITVTNREPRTDTFALKAVFDTVLGEKTDTHFSTAQTKSINSETQYRTMKNEKWVMSQGAGYGVQLLLYGGDITPPSLVTLGNKDIISLPLWEPVASPARSFDNVMSYNNSAVAVNWEKTGIKPSGSSSVIFYIVVSADGESPAGGTYLASLAESSAGTEPAAAPAAKPVPAVKQPVPPAEVPFEVITEEKLDPAYIRALIARINALEDDDKSVNRDELLRLNAELDAILARLRQQ